MKLKYFQKHIILLFIFCLNVNTTFGQLYEVPSRTKKLTEKKLIKGLESQDRHTRASMAAEIIRRLIKGEYEIGVGNIIEHEEDYWPKKVKKIRRWTDYDEFEKEFGITIKNRTPNYNNIKAYRLDHMNILYVEQNPDQTKVKKYRLMYVPQGIRVEPPSNFSGIWRTYHVNGVVAIETSYDEGKKDGNQTIYYENGNANWSNFFKEDMIFERRRYNRDEILTSKKIYNKEEREEWLRMYKIESQFPKD